MKCLFLRMRNLRQKVKFFVKICAFGSVRTQCILSINADNTDKNDKDSKLESYKADSEISEILRIKKNLN